MKELLEIRKQRVMLEKIAKVMLEKIVKNRPGRPSRTMKSINARIKNYEKQRKEE